MRVWLVDVITTHDVIVLAKGTVDGQAASKFVRSFVRGSIVAECQEGHETWRWVERKARGKLEVNKIRTYYDVSNARNAAVSVTHRW